MNSVKHISLRIGRLDLSKNVNKNVDKKLVPLTTAFLQAQFKKEVDSFILSKSKNVFARKIKIGENIYTVSSGHYCGLINKGSKISQIIYNKSEQLSYKLIKSSRKKGFSMNMIKRYEKLNDLNGNEWRLELQAYGYRAISKAVNSYSILMRKLEKYLFYCIKIVNKVDMHEFDVLFDYIENNANFLNWFNDNLNESLKPPNLLTEI